VFGEFKVFERYWSCKSSDMIAPVLMCWDGYVGFKLGGMNNFVQKKIRIV